MILEEFPNYDITQDGRVFSLNYNNTKEKKELVNKVNNSGYAVVGITNSKGKRQFIGVHRLVAKAYIKGDDSLDVNHIDGVKLNNNVSNLEWCTKQENIRHSFDTGLNKGHKSNVNGNYQGEDVIHSKLTEEDVLSIRERYSKGESVINLAKEYGLSSFAMNAAISKTAKVRTWVHLPYPEYSNVGQDRQSKSVLQCTKEGEIIEEYDSIKDAAKALGKHHSNISKCCNGKVNSAYGFVWKFKQQEKDK